MKRLMSLAILAAGLLDRAEALWNELCEDGDYEETALAQLLCNALRGGDSFDLVVLSQALHHAAVAVDARLGALVADLGVLAGKRLEPEKP